MEDRSSELEVELTQTVPLRGVVRCGDQEPRSFEGWVSLASAVDACVAEEARRVDSRRFAER